MSIDASPTIASQTIDGFLESLNAKIPTPGGGAAAAITGATAAATAGMVVSYSVDKKSLSEFKLNNSNAQNQLNRAREMFLMLGDEDAAGYSELNYLWKLDKADPQRVARWDNAVAGAIGPPKAMLALALDVLRLCEQLINTTNRQLKSDLGVAAVLFEATARSAAWNVKINIPLLETSMQQTARDEVDSFLKTASELCKTIETGCM
ncbi:MAG: cyclodeaminase/cyclohydrolase family protein [Phycisphaerales bacterium]|nr:cyclodeaminase/cyclohydrolase family protein [Phycisphaerales bacterium]